MKHEKCIVWAALLLILGSSCQSPKNEEKAGDFSVKDTLAQEQTSAASNSIQHQLHKMVGEKDTVTFAITEPSLVKVTLTVPGDSGNIRINQVVMPDGRTDGPFGKTYTDSLSATGTYTLIIAESLMQEHPYTGDYKLKIEY